MDNNTTLLLDLDGVLVERVERLADGGRLVHVATAEESARACPGCGVFATAVKGYVVTHPRDLQLGSNRLYLRWRKRRWYCTEARCERASFTESVPQIPAGARITTRLRQAAGITVRDHGHTVVQAAREYGLGWPTVMRALRQVAAPLAETEPGPVTVLGIDETRRGRPKWVRAEDGTWTLVRDRWHVGFTDLSGGQGLFGQVEGRTAAAVTAWLDARGEEWKRQVTHVAIDMCTIFKSAVTAALPHAVLVVDHFHIVQLANNTVTEVRQHTTVLHRRRRGRKGDGEWDVRRLLGRNREDLTDRQFAKMWNTLVDLGRMGERILTAYIAKEKLRDLLALARTHPERSLTSRKLWTFLTWCADSGLPELERLARTIDAWWPQIEAFLLTGITNAASEGHNRVVKLTARCAYGFRNADNQRLRTRCVTTRRGRGCLNPAQDR